MVWMALILMAGAAEPAAPPPAAAPVPVVAQVGADDQVTCRRQAEPNSLILKKVCMTNGQWKQRMRDDQDAAQGLQRQALRATSGSGAP